jgi:hypothetical protein
VGRQSQQSKDRRARVEAIRAQQRREERRRTLLIVGTAVAIAVALIATVAVMVVREQRRDAALAAAADKPIDGVQDFPNLTRLHTTEPVDYPQDPPVGGNHAPVWTNCGTYDESIEPAQAVHSLEHGAVWITYQPSLPAAQVETLFSLTESNDYALLSPYEGQGSPLVLTAWGKQLALDSADDPRLEVFLRAYLKGPQTPEPGAPCTGGAGQP